MHILRGRRHSFYEKTLFCLVLLYACFLVALWCFKLHLVSMLCCSHRIVFMCWTCIHPYVIVLYWLHVRWSFALLYDYCSHFHMTVMCLIKLLICFTSCLLDHFLLVTLYLSFYYSLYLEGLICFVQVFQDACILFQVHHRF